MKATALTENAAAQYWFPLTLYLQTFKSKYPLKIYSIQAREVNSNFKLNIFVKGLPNDDIRKFEFSNILVQSQNIIYLLLSSVVVSVHSTVQAEG